MTDVTGLCRGELFETGRRYTESVSFEEFDTVLVLDDSVYSGTQMTETRERLADEEFPFDIEYGAIYVTRDSRKYVDHWSEVVPAPRVFEWNVMHHDILRNACVDIDGVLCRDPTPAENDDGENYREFLTQVEPSVVPNRRIGWLVTCRLEKYREETEAWLNEHGIDYRRLVMMDYPDMETRQAAGDHAAFKARVYDEAETKLFIESTREQAREICERTGKPVFCYESAELFEPDQTTKIRQNSRSYLSQFYENPVGFSQVAIKYLVRQLST